MEINKKGKSTHNILLVDDFPEHIVYLEDILQEEGRTFFKANSGQEALKIAREVDLSLILLDVQMPDLDGFQTAERLMESPKTRKIPIIFVTAINTESKYVLKGLEDGAVDYLFKPLDPQITRAKVATLLRYYHQQNELVLSERLAALGQLTAGVAHEINNPINFISANIAPLKRDLAEIRTVLEKYSQLDENNFHDKLEEIRKIKTQIDFDYIMKEIDSLMHGIEEGSKRTTEIVKGLRNFSRVDEEEMKPYNIHEGIDSTLMLFGSKLKFKHIEIHKSYCNDCPEIRCYPGQLNQVFLNLISNAMDAMGEYNPAEKKERKISVTSSNENNYLKICVRDTGPGMSPEIMKKIFDPFFTTKDIGKGTGLGLSISYEIIEKHLGKIEVKSEPGAGTEFMIWLPYTQANN